MPLDYQAEQYLAALQPPNRLEIVDGAPDPLFSRKAGQVCVYVNNASLYFIAGDDDDTGDADGAGWRDSATPINVKVAVEYFDKGTETIRIGYTPDGTSETLATIVTKTNTKTWKKKTLKINGVLLGTDFYGIDDNETVGGGGDHYNADFRIFSSGDLYLGSLALTNRTTKAAIRFPAYEYLNQTSIVPPGGLPGTGDEFDDELLAGWTVTPNEFSADSGNFRIRSDVPALTLGAATDFLTGEGFFVGKSGGYYSQRIGNPAGQYMSYNGATGQLYVNGTLVANAGIIGGFEIGADYLRDTGNSFGLASTVTGGDDVRFWAGDTFNNRAVAPLQIYESGLIFAKDIILANGQKTGNSGATGYGMAVDPLFLCHFDGTPPIQSDFRGSAIGHKGQYETRTGGVIFPLGKFGKAVQIAEATTNYVLNPSAEATGNYAARGTATVTRDAFTSLFDGYSYKVVLAAANDGIDLTTSSLANAIHMVTFWATGSALSTLEVSLNGSTWNAISQLSSETFLANTWTWCGVSIPAAQANGSTTLRIRNTASSGTFYIDGVQVEAKSNYPTPFCGGGLGGSTDTTVINGHSWSGTANASNSVRVAAGLTYPSTGNFNYQRGTISFWYFERGYSHSGYPTALDIYYDASNFLRIHLGGYGGGLTPYVANVWGGTGASGAAAYSQAAVTGGWHHLAYTWDAGGYTTIYIDGVRGASRGSNYNPSTPAGVPTIHVGRNNAGTNAINTKLDDLAILPYVLSENEIKAIYYSSAPLVVGANSQEFRLSGEGLGEIFGNALGLFGRNAIWKPSFMLANGTVNATVAGGASETLDSGDLLLGDNNASKANMLYDASAGRLNFRGGTTTQAYIDTSGAFVAGNGDVTVNTDGLSFAQGSGSTSSIKWKNGSTTYGRIYATAAAAAGLYLTNDKNNNAAEGQIGIESNNSSGSGKGEFYVNAGSFRWYQNGTAAGGLAMGLGGTMASKTSTTTIQNTTTETSLGRTATIPANCANAGDCIKITAAGYYSTTSTPTLRFRAFLGATQVANTTAFTPTGSGVTNRGWRLEIYIPIRSIGASGTVFAHGWGTLGRTDIVDLVETATTTIDFTASQVVDLKFTWGAASSSNSLKCTLLQIEYLTPDSFS